MKFKSLKLKAERAQLKMYAKSNNFDASITEQIVELYDKAIEEAENREGETVLREFLVSQSLNDESIELMMDTFYKQRK